MKQYVDHLLVPKIDGDVNFQFSLDLFYFAQRQSEHTSITLSEYRLYGVSFI